jgi:hypothetical protein
MSDTLPPDVKKAKDFPARVQVILERAMLRQEVLSAVLSHYFPAEPDEAVYRFRHHTANLLEPIRTMLPMVLDETNPKELASHLRLLADAPEREGAQSQTEQLTTKALAAFDKIGAVLDTEEGAQKVSGAEEELMREYALGLQNDLKALLRAGKEAAVLAQRLEGSERTP